MLCYRVLSILFTLFFFVGVRVDLAQAFQFTPPEVVVDGASGTYNKILIGPSGRPHILAWNPYFGGRSPGWNHHWTLGDRDGDSEGAPVLFDGSVISEHVLSSIDSFGHQAIVRGSQAYLATTMGPQGVMLHHRDLTDFALGVGGPSTWTHEQVDVGTITGWGFTNFNMHLDSQNKFRIYYKKWIESLERTVYYEAREPELSGAPWVVSPVYGMIPGEEFTGVAQGIVGIHAYGKRYTLVHVWEEDYTAQVRLVVDNDQVNPQPSDRQYVQILDPAWLNTGPRAFYITRRLVAVDGKVYIAMSEKATGNGPYRMIVKSVDAVNLTVEDVYVGEYDGHTGLVVDMVSDSSGNLYVFYFRDDVPFGGGTEMNFEGDILRNQSDSVVQTLLDMEFYPPLFSEQNSENSSGTSAQYRLLHNKSGAWVEEVIAQDPALDGLLANIGSMAIDPATDQLHFSLGVHSQSQVWHVVGYEAGVSAVPGGHESPTPYVQQDGSSQDIYEFEVFGVNGRRVLPRRVKPSEVRSLGLKSGMYFFKPFDRSGKVMGQPIKKVIVK